MKDSLEEQQQKWRTSQNNYERQVTYFLRIIALMCIVYIQNNKSNISDEILVVQN